MTEIKLNNIIRFSFNFHTTMGCDLTDFSPDYILEKWYKYLGDIKPIEISISDDRQLYIKNTFVDWIAIWGEESYKDMLNYLNIIRSINSKSFKKYESFSDKIWLPSELIELFEKSTEGVSTKIEYNFIHDLIKMEIDNWFNYEEVKRDIIQVKRDIKINNIIS